MIKAIHLFKSFNNHPAVTNLSFEVKEGENLVILGTSGCGKTTTLRMLNRLVEPSSGEVFINGQSIFSQPVSLLRRKMGYVLQNNGLFPHYTIEENIAIVPKLLHWEKDRIRERITNLLIKLNMDPEQVLSSYPDQLSGGQQQRIGLARAMAADPPIMLMDEPFGALDPVTRAGIRKQFMELDELKKKTIVMVTHDVQEAFELADRICLMDKGNIMQMGKPLDLLFHPANNFVKGFFNENRLLLELKTTLLKDIWEYFQYENGINTDQFDFNWDLSLWTIMNILSEHDFEKNEWIVTNNIQQRKRIHYSGIMQALNKFRKTFDHA